MKYYIIAGEKSGDQHAANLITALKQQDASAEFRGWGGEAMQAAGTDLVQHYSEMAFMGIWEVVKHLGKIRRFLNRCKQDIIAYQPDVVILVDYAGFNLRIAKFAKKQGFKVFYYISPKIWAWNQGRAKTIRQIVDKMFVVLPFEKDFYRNYDYEVDYVGNPVYDMVKAFKPQANFKKKHFLPDKPIIAVLPGSRKQEVLSLLEPFLSITHFFPDYQFVVAGVSTLPKEVYAEAQHHEVMLVFDETYDLLYHSKAAIVASGTASLETALFKVPQVVCYKVSPVTYWIGRMVVKAKYMALPNLIMDKKIVPELLQKDFNTNTLIEELHLVLHKNRLSIAADYRELEEKLKRPSVANYTASLMWKYLNEK